MAKKSRQSLIILRTKKAMKVKLKATFIIFKGLSATKNCVCEREKQLSLFLKAFQLLKIMCVRERQRETLEISLSGH